MAEIVASVPDELAAAVDAAAAALQSSRAAVVCQALERYMEDFDDLAAAAERMRDAGGGVNGMDERDGRDLMNG